MSTILNATSETTPVHTIVSNTAFNCTQNCSAMLLYPVAAVTQSVTKPGPPSDGALNTPVSNAPRIPPTAWMPNTSRASSARRIFFRPLTPHRHTSPAAMPITNAPRMPTLPAAGVIATNPATAPDAAPSIDGLPLSIHSANVQASTAHAVARNVLTNASTAELLASSAEPALNPNHPNQSNDAPIIVIVRLRGGMRSRPSPRR